MFQILNAYLDKPGQAFAALCCFVWSISVVTEISAIIKIMRVTVSLRGTTTIIVVSSGRRQITALSTARITIFLALQLFRLVIGLALLAGGMQYLAYTISLSDLLLNTVHTRGPICLRMTHARAHTRTKGGSCVHSRFR